MFEVEVESRTSEFTVTSCVSEICVARTFSSWFATESRAFRAGWPGATSVPSAAADGNRSWCQFWTQATIQGTIGASAGTTLAASASEME